MGKHTHVIQIDDDIRLDISRACLKCYCYASDECSTDCKLTTLCNEIANRRNIIVGDFNKWSITEIQSAMTLVKGKGEVSNELSKGILDAAVDK